MDLSTALRYLDEHTNLEATAGWVHGLSLDKMRALAHVLGDPQLAFPVIHVTGTNGKGSVSRMATELLRASGLSVGTYTSPHLERINERLAYDGEPIADDALAAQIAGIAAAEELSGVSPSYFEILTAAAFRWFADLAVDVAVVEVGLLGRYDATNVVDAEVAVVTNVGRDHTDGQGAWREAIASEKAGIIKPRSHLVLGETDPDLVPVFLAEGPAATWLRERDFDCTGSLVAMGGRVVDLTTPHGAHREVYVPVHGAHQADNAALALAAVEAFFDRSLGADVVAEGFASVRLPGRFELVGRAPTVILDAAHNPDGAAAAARTLAEEFTLTGSLGLVVGFLQGRDPVEMLRALRAEDAGFLVACTPPSPRAIPAAEVAAAADSLGIPAEAVATPAEAVDRALALSVPDDLILVTGSLYVVGEARAHLAQAEEAR